VGGFSLKNWDLVDFTTFSPAGKTADDGKRCDFRQRSGFQEKPTCFHPPNGADFAHRIDISDFRQARGCHQNTGDIFAMAEGKQHCHFFFALKNEEITSNRYMLAGKK